MNEYGAMLGRQHAARPVIPDLSGRVCCAVRDGTARGSVVADSVFLRETLHRRHPAAARAHRTFHRHTRLGVPRRPC